MKTTKFVLVITFVAFAAMIYAQADRTSPNKPAPHQRVVKIALEKAVLDRGLKIALYKQVQPGFLLNDQPLYFARVYYHRAIYLVYGNYNEWKAFLKMAIEKDPER